MSENYEVQLGGDVYLELATYDSDGAPANAAALPTYAIWDYDLSAQVSNGTGTLATVDATISGWYFKKHTPTAADGFAAEKQYKVRHSYTVGGTSYTEYQTITVY